MICKRLILILACFFCQISWGAEQDKETNFIINKDSNKLTLELEIPKKHIIYSIHPEPTGLPTKVELKRSSNLNNYKLIWPDPLLVTSPIGEKTYFYENHLKVPLLVEARNPTKNIELEFEIEYVLCSNQCELKQEHLSVVIIPEDLKNNLQLASVFDAFWIMLIAVLGGFILNFMPCVLPVLSLKVINFIRHPNLNRKKASLFTILGVLSSFWGLAFIAIIFKSTGKYFGLGLNFQEPTFVIALTIIITFFISVSLDRVVFKFPEPVNNFLLSIKLQGQYIEHYFSGVIATILSTPCTAPFLGTALFFSFQQSNLFIFFTFTSIGLGFSMPYILMLIFPKALKFLPTSGKWMNNLKLILATSLIGTIIWLLYILEAQINLRAVVILFLLLLLIKFTLENNIYFLKYPLIKLIILFILVIFIFLLPKYSYLEDKNYQEKVNSLWQKFEPEKIDSLVKSGKIVFVDITADWCITCKYNKYLVFSRDKTIKTLSDTQIIAMRGDFTNYDLQIHDFLSKRKIPGIPYNVIFSQKFPGGLELPVLLSIKEIEDGVKQAR
jgi:suppressor for copper-sensitivity B